MEGEAIVILDVGTTKICAMIGEYNDEGLFRVAGAAAVSAAGLRRGMVTNIDLTSRTIADLIDRAEQEAGRTATEVIIGITGNSAEGSNTSGIIAITRKARQVRPEDLDQVMDMARATQLPLDREVIHALVQGYLLDEHQMDQPPLGMTGVRLEAKVHLITGSSAITQNLSTCIQRLNLKVKEIVIGSVTALGSLLSREERQMGVLYIDIGGESTDFYAVFGDAPVYTGVLPVGGVNVSGDLAYIFKIPVEQAEQVKLEYGCCEESFLDGDDQILLPGRAGKAPRTISTRDVCEVIHARMEELFVLIRKEMAEHQLLYKLGGGVVISGGGSEISGCGELASEVFNLNVRIASSVPLKDLPAKYNRPAFSTATALLAYGERVYRREKDSSSHSFLNTVKKNPFKGLAEWFKEFI